MIRYMISYIVAVVGLLAEVRTSAHFGFRSLLRYSSRSTSSSSRGLVLLEKVSTMEQPTFLPPLAVSAACFRAPVLA